MKKLLSIALCSALSLSALSTGFTLTDNSEKQPAYDHAVIITDNTKNIDYSKNPVIAKGLELITQMDKAAESESYRQLMSGSDELNQIVEDIAGGDYSIPKAVYKTSVAEGEALKAFSGLAIDELPEEIRSSVDKKLMASIPSQINAAEGVNMIAATSVLTTSDVVLLDNIDGNQLYVFIYDDITAMVSYIPYEDGIVYASANFVKLDNIESSDDLTDWFKDNLGMELVFETAR